MIKKFLIPFTAILILCVTVSAAPKTLTSNNPPRLLIAEIKNYSVNDLKPEVANNFYSVLADVLKEDFNVESRRLIANNAANATIESPYNIILLLKKNFLYSRAC